MFGVILGTGAGGGIVVERRSSSAPTRSPASGATIRCRGRADGVARRRAIADGTAASRRSCPEPGWRATTRDWTVRSRRRTDLRAAARYPLRWPRSRSTRIDSRARSPALSTCSTLMSSSSAADSPISSCCTNALLSCGALHFSDRVDTHWSERTTAIRAESRGCVVMAGGQSRPLRIATRSSVERRPVELARRDPEVERSRSPCPLQKQRLRRFVADAQPLGSLVRERTMCLDRNEFVDRLPSRTFDVRVQSSNASQLTPQ